MEMTQLVSKLFNRNLLAGLILSIPLLSSGQSLARLEYNKAKYPGNYIVQTKNERTVTIKYEKGVPKVVYHFEYEDVILDKKGVQLLSEYAIDFTSFEVISNIQAYTLIPNGTKSKKVVSTNFFTRDADASGGVFHDDGKETIIVFPGLIEGAMRHISYDVTMNNLDFPFGFIFFDYSPTENPTLKVICDTSIHLMMKEYYTDKINLKKEESVVKNMRTSIYSCEQALLLKPEDNAPSMRYYAPQIFGQIDYYNFKGKRTNVIGSVKDLHDRYAENVVEVENEIPSKEITRIADSITKNLTVEFDKVQAIYYWVQDHIKYIAFEEGMGGFVPRQPSLVVDKRFGDCKDMASLIYSMLKAVKITSYLTWVGSRTLPFKYSEFPSGICDNHMITTYKNNGNYYFLDATNSFQTMKSSTSFIQGKEALIHISPTEFELTTIPVQPANYTKVYDYSKIKIDGKDLIGSSTCSIDGYYHTLIGNYAKDVPEKEINKFLASVNERGNNSFNVTRGNFENISKRDTAGIMNFDWTCKNYCTVLNDEIYINMILDKGITYQNEFKENRVAPFELDNTSSDQYIVELEIPQNYTVNYVPKPINYHSDNVDFEVIYEVTKDRIILKLNINLKFILLYPSDFEEWNKFIALKKKAISESVELKRKA